jgi:perosamine synthetase
MGLTAMDFTKHHTPEVEAILKTGIRLTLHQDMTDEYILGAAEAVRKVAKYYAA